MDSPSSTSSSRGAVPWLAPLCAVGLVLLFDRLVLGPDGPWEVIRERLELRPVRETRLEMGIANDHLELARLAEAGPDMRRVIVMGNSRARVGLRFDRLPAATLGDLVVARCTHAPIAPWVMHSAVERFLAHDPDLVVLLLSELDTHRQVNTVPTATFGGLATVRLLSAGIGEARHGLDEVPGRSWLETWTEERSDLQRLALASVLRAYRYRPVLGHAWLDPFRRFTTQSASIAPDEPERFPSARASYDAPSDELPEVPGLDVIRAELEAAVGTVRPHTLRLVNRIRVGPHVALQEQIVEDTVARLSEAGARVLIVEGPLNPASHPLYDRAQTRAEFLAFVGRLAGEYGVSFLSLEETGPFRPRSFTDVLHLDERSSMRLTQATLARVRALLDVRDGSPDR